MGKVILVIGLGFGDEGKGSILNYLSHTENPSCIIRFNGGAQCAHNVVLPNGIHHTFAQFGSGTFSGVKTHLSRYMLVNPLSLDNEAEALSHLIKDPYSLLTIDREALITNPFQVAANRIKEVQREANRHGSCGMGIGETVEDSIAFPDMAIRVRDLQNSKVLREKLCFSRDLKTLHSSTYKEDVDYYIQRFIEIAKKLNIVDESYLGNLLKQDSTILFEGAQGVLLDQDYGFHPYTTWTDTTFGNAHKLLESVGYTGDIRHLGVLRGYLTRHGAGPFPTEINASESMFIKDEHNKYHQFQREFRVGYFDVLLARYALEVVGGVDELAVTNLDKLSGHLRICTAYHEKKQMQVTRIPVQKCPVKIGVQEELTAWLTKVTPVGPTFDSRDALVTAIQKELRVPITICSTGPTYNNKIFSKNGYSSKITTM